MIEQAKAIVSHGIVDLLRIDDSAKRVWLRVNVSCAEEDVPSYPVQQQIWLSVKTMINYLDSEGFIDNAPAWTVITVVVGKK